jgi:ankyrin repeat protein
MKYDYDTLIAIIAGSDIAAFEEAASATRNFPHGQDDLVQRFWITNAIDCGSLTAIRWMLSKNVNLHFHDNEGYTPIHSALNRSEQDRYEIIKLLIAHGADVNAYGVNDWTPSHMAAVWNDLPALKLLRTAGADFSLRTHIDHYSTPLEEAIILNRSPEAVAFLKSINTTEQGAAANP